MIPSEWLQAAQKRVQAFIRSTPLTYDPSQELYLKWENRQVTGSFKARGALNKVLTLEKWEQEKGLVAASAGNHGQGVALAGKFVAAPVIIFVPENAPPTKIEAIRALGAEVRLVAGGYGDTETAGLAYASQAQATWVSPYNDGQVIAGQGTLGLETLEQLKQLQLQQPLYPTPSTWIVPTSGGGLLAGVGTAIKAKNTQHEQASRHLVGVQSEASPFMHDLFYSGTQDQAVELPSLADGLAGRVEENSVTIPLVKKLADEIVLVNEDEIAEAVAYSWNKYGEVIEGSAATALAAALSGKISIRPALVVLSGGNIQPEIHADIISR
ncbi:threonine/serine dehydratase [Chloroflexota bacterium]